MFKLIGLLASLIALAAAWRWTPAGEWLDVDRAMTAAKWLAQQPASPLLAPVAFAIGGAIAIPVTLMIIATVAIFGPWPGILYSLIGAEIGALLLFVAGRRLGREAVRRFAGSLINRLSHKLSQRGIMAVVTVRIVPVAPFAVVNIIAGASEIRLRDFAIGSFIGLIPGTLAIGAVASQLIVALRHADPPGFVGLATVVVLAGAGVFWIRRWLSHRHAGNARRGGS
jgi:uncharacterized membrane protein YdjX (TVP38/TMEM64 family)